jgi:phage terminase large subunit-like protein
MSRAELVIAFIEEYLVVPEGAQVGKPIRLRPFQKDAIHQIYGSPTRQAIVSMGRKNGKTALISMLMLAHLVGPEARRNGQIYSAAQSRDQAGIVYSLASKMVQRSPDLADPSVIRIRESAKELFSPLTGVRYKALSAEATTAYGFSPVMVVHDELGQVRGPKSPLYDALETAMGAQASPLSIVISTQAPNPTDLLSLLMDYALTEADPLQKLILYEAPIDDPIDDPETWRKANPALGDFLNESEIAGLAKKALRMPSFEATFRNLHLNQRVAAEGQLFSPTVWGANGGEADMSAFYECPVYGGLDLSAKQDLTALVLLAEKPKGVWNVWAHFWTPEATLNERARRDRQPYEIWASKGFLTTVPGVTIDHRYVAQRLGELSQSCDLREIKFDRWNIEALEAALSAEGISIPLAKCGQGYRDMSPAIDALEVLALQERLRHANNPLLTMCASNAIVVSDPAGNRKLEKQKSSGRIDGMVALAMAAAAALGDATPIINIRALIG